MVVIIKVVLIKHHKIKINKINKIIQIIINLIQTIIIINLIIKQIIQIILIIINKIINRTINLTINIQILEIKSLLMVVMEMIHMTVEWGVLYK